MPQAMSVSRKKWIWIYRYRSSECLKQSYLSEHYDLEDRILTHYPQAIKEYERTHCRL